MPDIPQRRARRISGAVADRRRGCRRLDRRTARPIADVRECAQQTHYEHLVFQFWEHHPGAKAKLAVQATGMMWNPRVGIEGAQESGVDSAPPLGRAALHGAAVPARDRGAVLRAAGVPALALIFVLYETAAAWVFAGTTRYRVPWDFVLALLAAAALDRAWRKVRGVG